ncbi:MAG TPA: hypothetical protein VFU55_06995 [Terracidiphilus sp.]|nr:hypothetical protein [Terracidiphilus sp.]
MMLCPFCGSDQLRVSRFRSHDLKYLFRMRYPVRCHQCMGRMHPGVYRVLLLCLSQRGRRRYVSLGAG